MAQRRLCKDFLPLLNFMFLISNCLRNWDSKTLGLHLHISFKQWRKKWLDRFRTKRL